MNLISRFTNLFINYKMKKYELIWSQETKLVKSYQHFLMTDIKLSWNVTPWIQYPSGYANSTVIHLRNDLSEEEVGS